MRVTAFSAETAASGNALWLSHLESELVGEIVEESEQAWDKKIWVEEEEEKREGEDVAKR